MEKIRFAHLSDTHICKDYSGNQMKDLFEKAGSPGVNLEKCLRELEARQLDFVLISGDLVHEGTSEDYRYLNDMVCSCMPTTHVIYALGNHDKKQEFRAGLQMDPDDRSLYYIKNINGLRVIVLDSAVPGKESGNISEEQVEWLEGILLEKAPKGSIITFHHPVEWEVEELGMQITNRLWELLKNSDVLGIFCGHTHANSLNYLEHIPQITADSMAFGLGIEGDKLSFTDKTGYCLCEINDGRLQVHYETSSPKPTAFVTFELSALKKAMQ